MSKRKPHNDLAGYKCSRRNDINKAYVVVVDADEAHLDTEGGRWVVICMKHDTLINVSSLDEARPLMKIPEFCKECMKDRP